MATRVKGTTAMLSCLGILAWIPLMVIARGWALSVLWGWFIVPMFHLPKVGIAQAIALSLVLSVYAKTESTRTSDEEKTHGISDVVGRAIGNLCGPLFIVGFAWLVKLFI